MKKLLVLLLLLSGSALGEDQVPRPKDSKAERQLFLDPSPMIARRVEVSGYLQQDEHGSSLYPEWVSRERLSNQYCLPLLISSDNSNLQGRISGLNKKVVKVDGLVVYSAADPGAISVFACKQLGVFVISVEEVAK